MARPRPLVPAVLLLALPLLMGACGGTTAPTATTTATARVLVAPTLAPTASATGTASPTVAPTAVATSVPATATPPATIPPATATLPPPTEAPSMAMAVPVPTAAPDTATVPEWAEVRIVDFAFEPATLTVPVGTTAVWRNTGVQHTVRSLTDYVRIASDILEGGDAFSFTFAHAGTYPYICGLHPEMEGTIVVR